MSTRIRSNEDTECIIYSIENGKESKNKTRSTSDDIIMWSEEIYIVFQTLKLERDDFVVEPFFCVHGVKIAFAI